MTDVKVSVTTDCTTLLCDSLSSCVVCLPSSAAYKYADGKKIDSKRVVVDVERGRTVKSWRPRRLGEWCGCGCVEDRERKRLGKEVGKVCVYSHGIIIMNAELELCLFTVTNHLPSLPYHLGGGLGGTRRGAPHENIKYSGRVDER